MPRGRPQQATPCCQLPLSSSFSTSLHLLSLHTGLHRSFRKGTQGRYLYFTLTAHALATEVNAGNLPQTARQRLSQFPCWNLNSYSCSSRYALVLSCFSSMEIFRTLFHSWCPVMSRLCVFPSLSWTMGSLVNLRPPPVTLENGCARSSHLFSRPLASSLLSRIPACQFCSLAPPAGKRA